MMICFFFWVCVWVHQKGVWGRCGRHFKEGMLFLFAGESVCGEGRGGGGGDIDWFCGQPSGLEGIFRLNLSCLVHGRAIEMYVGGKMVSDWIELLKKFHFGNIVGLCG